MAPTIRIQTAQLVLACALIAGCAHNAGDCSKGTGQDGCAPGTAEYEEMIQRQKDAKAVDEIDDVRCQALSAPGSPAYSECRRKAAADRQLGETTLRR